MKIKYNLSNEIHSYEQKSKIEIEKLNFVLSNNKGDFLNMGVINNSSKFQGYNICNPETLDIFKFVDEILLNGLEVDSVEYGGYYILRNYKSKLSQIMEIPIADENIKAIKTLGDNGKLKYSDSGILEEVVEEPSIIEAQDRFYIGPKGGFIYEIFNYEGNITIDLDIKKLNDFDEWGRVYDVYEKNGIVFVKFTKKKGEDEDYTIVMGIKAVNFAYNLIKDFVKKEYSYSKQRNSEFERYVYRLMSLDVSLNKRLIFGAGFSEKEVIEQISLLDLHQNELEKFGNDMFNDLTKNSLFSKPITQDISVAYKLSGNAIYKFLNKELKHPNVKQGCYAGFPWFANIWTRDELVGLRAFINKDDEAFVKETLFEYLNSINLETGMLKRIKIDGSLQSPDSCFWLAKRFEDFMFHLDEKGRLDKVLTEGELKIIYDKLYQSFKKIVESSWDEKEELLTVKYADSWMDTIEVEYPLDIQVQFLEFISFICIIGQTTGKKEELEHLKDFEFLLKSKIRQTYFRNGFLYAEPNKDRIDSNIFLAYYLYPDLFTQKDWETIFDNSLIHLETSWGAISSLSKKDSNFQENYTGENNLSYHQGDSWYWINNIAAIAMHDLNEKKYRSKISKILTNSTKDILKLGTIGFASEISSASSQKAEGCMAQFWSSSTYIEMIDKLFEKEE